MMKNWALVFLISSLLSALGMAQESTPTAPPATEHGAAPAAEHGAAAPAEHAAGSGKEEHGGAGKEEHDAGDPMIMWKWINFALLAVGLGYLASQHLPAFFASRTEEIQKGIAEAAKLKADSDIKAAAMEQRMAKLGAEIESLRAHGKSEMAAEGERIRQETAASLAKLQSHAESEIEAATKAAKQELKSYSAELAINLAGERIAARGGSSTGMFERFIADLEKKGANN